MAVVAVTVKLSIPDFYKVIKVMGDMRPVFAAIGAEVLKEVGKNFENQGTWSKWAPLRPNTIAGRRAGNSSKALQASGRLRASFRMQPMKSQVRVGSPLLIAQFHEEGRGEPVGNPGWMIFPKHGKALAFAVASGGKAVGGKEKFKSYGHKKRSAKFLKNQKMAVVSSVYHPGYPARKMLPHPSRALTIARNVVSKFLEGGGGPA